MQCNKTCQDNSGTAADRVSAEELQHPATPRSCPSSSPLSTQDELQVSVSPLSQHNVYGHKSPVIYVLSIACCIMCYDQVLNVFSYYRSVSVARILPPVTRAEVTRAFRSFSDSFK